MSCENVRSRIEAGEPLGDDLLAHLKGCPSCGKEFAFLPALRGASPKPPPELRDRLLASAAPRRSWLPWAAAILVALGAGFVAGRGSRPPAEVRTVEVEKPASPQQFSVLGYALRGLYRNAVEVRFDENRVTHVAVDTALTARHPTCPVLKEARRISDARPDLVAWR